MAIMGVLINVAVVFSKKLTVMLNMGKRGGGLDKYLRSGVNREFKFGFLSEVYRQTFHQKRGEPLNFIVKKIQLNTTKYN